MLQDAANTGLIEGHDEMPSFDFSATDMKALLAYIDGLAGDGAGRYLKNP